jgi:hypothetical protein
MPNEDKLEKLVLALIRATTQGEIKWELTDVPRQRLRGTDDVIDFFLVTIYKGQEIAVFEKKYKAFDIETESMYWTTADCFAFISFGEVKWETDQQPLLSSLLKVARESAANVDGIIDSLLS